MQRKIVGEFYRNTMLCVDSYDKGVPAGRFYNPIGSCEYQSLTQLLNRMENMLDEMELPQSFMAVRSFGRNGEARIGQPETRIEQGRLATFAVRILFRQNASWQGSVKWLEGGKEESFRSALELIFLIDSVLNDMEDEKAG